MKIGNEDILKGNNPFLIAEAGINHNGELGKAFSMIEVAKKCGADAIKFQTFKAAEFVGDTTLEYTYYSRGVEVTELMLEMFQRYEFTSDEWFMIKNKCDECGILFLSTPQNVSDLELLQKLSISAIKVGSDDFTNIPLLKKYAKTKLPLLLSCGMADLAEVYQTLEAVGALDGYPTALLLCTSQYPTAAENVNLRKLKTLHHSFPMVTLGFSDHTQGALASSLAVAMGATIFEKHFTLDHDLPGPDHWFSENPDGLRQWIDSIRTAYTMLGESIVRPTKDEKAMQEIARRSLIATDDIEIGQKITVDNLGTKRPGCGIAPNCYEKILGLTAVKKIRKGQFLTWGDFE